jgi:CheY-like chemotaxis protein
MVKVSADALLTVINDILDFSKIEAGKLDLESTDFDLIDCVETTLKTLALRADEKGLELFCDLGPGVPETVRGDPGRLQQVIANLVSNAIKFTAQGEVGLRATLERTPEQPSFMHFTVSDTGIGIPPDKQQAIFEPFVQADSSTTRQHGGTGLGLTICSRLVNAMGGRIWVKSVAEGGTQFHFTVPLLPVTSSAGLKAGLDGEFLRGAKVLIVDDNATSRRILHALLRRWGLSPEAAAGGDDALRELASAHAVGRPYALMLADMQMPGMDGFTLCQHLRRRPELAPAGIIMLTSAGHRVDSGRGRELGIDAYLAKPVRQSALRQGILRLVSPNRQPGSHCSSSSAALQVALPRRNLRVLLAEDNFVNQQLASRLLEKKRYHVDVANNSRAALSALETKPYDVVLMDVQMPEMDGMEATCTIREQERHTGRHQVVIALTAHAVKEDLERCLAAGMDDYLVKPIRPQALYDLLARYELRA